MGPLLRMQTKLHFEVCRKMSRSNTCKKSHFVRKIHLDPDNTDLQYFLRKQFFAAIGAAYFPAVGTAIDASATAIFTLLLYRLA